MINEMTLRVSGLVTYFDNVIDEFGVTFENDEVVNPVDFVAENHEAFKQLWQEKNAQIKALLHSLGGTFAMSPGAPATNRAINDWSFVLTGTIGRSDNTIGVFSARYDSLSGNVVIGADVFAEILADVTQKANLDATLEALATTVTITA